jgi:Peptidase family M48
MIEGALVLYAAPTVLRAVGIPGLATLCQRMLNTLVPGGSAFGWLGAGLAVMILVGTGVGTVRARRQIAAVRAESGLGIHVRGRACDIVVLPTDATIAVSVGGNPGQIVVSEGLVGLLSEAELSAVLAHEVAHLRHRHQRFSVIATVVEHGLWSLPLMRRTTRSLRCGVERWADEEVIATVPDARLQLQSALLKVTSTSIGAALMAFSDSDAIAERLWALQNPPEQRRIALGIVLTPGLLLGTTGLAGTVVASATAWSVLTAAGHCPI